MLELHPADFNNIKFGLVWEEGHFSWDIFGRSVGFQSDLIYPKFIHRFQNVSISVIGDNVAHKTI
ncbi:hypothetical protein CHS0354_032867 [Potamilus streckersoni]|uniref:Uncharacterized protein n=1 Tax=Potamilus streckersoni TaxID=2493646 RepID=A0AAE0T1R1_9BIVA|nr:hypothetical protein CHS0354_032867 [Potamilus streckersoni]